MPESSDFGRTYNDLDEEGRERVLNIVAAVWNRRAKEEDTDEEDE